MKRAVIYSRFSSALQNDRSVEDQIELCKAYAARNNITIVGEYHDRARTGGTMFGREGMLKLLQDAPSGSFDVVLVEALDRISRDIADLATIHKQLKFIGVEILTVNDGAADTITIGLRGLVGQLFREDGAKKVRRGMAGVIREGRSAGGRAYGYKPVPGKPGELTIDPEEAAVIKEIFELYLEGLTPRSIAAHLNKKKIKPPRGSVWNASTINGNAERRNGLIYNPIYQGRIAWNRVSMVRDPATGKRISRVNPESEWQWTEVPHLRIVDEETARRALEQKQSRSKENGKPLVRSRRLLSGLLRCGHCGGGMSIADSNKGRHRIQCSRSKENGSCDNDRRIYLDKIENHVAQRLTALLKEPEAIQAYIDGFKETAISSREKARQDRTEARRRLLDVDASIKRVVSAISDGIMTADEAKSKLAELREEKEELEEIERLADASIEAGRVDTEAVQSLQRSLADLSTFMANPSRGVREAFARIVDKVIVTPGPPHRPANVEIIGILETLTQKLFVPVVAGERLTLNTQFTPISFGAGKAA